MAYKKSKNLPAEYASKISHIDIPRNKLINNLLEKLNVNNESEEELSDEEVIPLVLEKSNIKNIFVVDGSISNYKDKIQNKGLEGSLIKTGFLFLDINEYNEMSNRDICHFIVKETYLNNSYGLHSTFLPHKNLKYKNESLYNSIRYIIFDSFFLDEDLNNTPLETLKFLVFKKWKNEHKESEKFDCPLCNNKINLKYDCNSDICQYCNQEVFITDFIGFHKTIDIESEYIHEKIANEYMLVHETLLIMSFIKILYELSIKNDDDKLKDTLFIKDGPLALNGIYSKMTNYFNDFIKEIDDKGFVLNLIGQEKTGTFVDHFENNKNKDSIFILNNDYIRKKIYPSSEFSNKPYGMDTMYGSKIFLNYKNTHKLIITMTTKGKHCIHPSENDFSNFKEIVNTVCSILTYKYENGLYPISLINSKISLSTKPSGNILKDFINTYIE